MLIPTSLTPLSQSILFAAAQSAHRRHARALALGPGSTHTIAPAFLWDNSPVAELTVAAWGQSPKMIGRLFTVETPSSSPDNAKVSKTIKDAQKSLVQRAENRHRLIAWADGVFVLQWSQAELLQVMEEIEPFVADALYDIERLAAIAVGSYARLLDVLNRRFSGPTQDLALNLVAGLETPDSAMIADLIEGAEKGVWLEMYGRRADQELELATPRLGEKPDYLSVPTELSGSWDPSAARKRRERAMQDAISGVGLLQRSGLRTLVELTQNALVAHADARDVLASVMAASRRWSLAAANEGMVDNRLQDSGEIFMLELEEVKQMMTGEWHSRAQVQPLLEIRRQTVHPYSPQSPRQRREAPTPDVGGRLEGVERLPLGIAGDARSGSAYHLHTAADIPNIPLHAIALAPETTPAWAPLFLKIDAIATERGNWLCHTAAVGRAGGLPTIVAAPDLSSLQSGQRTELQPVEEPPGGGRESSARVKMTGHLPEVRQLTR